MRSLPEPGREMTPLRFAVTVCANHPPDVRPAILRAAFWQPHTGERRVAGEGCEGGFYEEPGAECIFAPGFIHAAGTNHPWGRV